MFCSIFFKHQSSYCRHKKKCHKETTSNTQQSNIITTELVLELIKDNKVCATTDTLHEYDYVANSQIVTNKYKIIKEIHNTLSTKQKKILFSKSPDNKTSRDAVL